MKENNEFLSNLSKDSGMKVPEGFFADFAQRMKQNLPEQDFEIQQEKVLPRSRWQQMRPYIYLAAMFMGIWCMMKMFDMMRPSEGDFSIDNNPALISAINDDIFVDDFYSEEGISDYDLFDDMYDQGMETNDFITLATYN